MKHAMIAMAWLGLAAAIAAPAPAMAAEAGDAVFAERGPWSLGQDALRWRMTLEGPAVEGFHPIAEGEIALAQSIAPADGAPVLELTRTTEDRSRRIGAFPSSGGDPVLTFFLEQTARDMALMTGGSPHYIRNRMKDALFRGGSIAHDGDTSTASFQPFADDPNAARMQGFEALTLTFVLHDPAEPIREFTAESAAGYRHHLVLQ